MKFILGRKIGMSQIFDEKGNQIPVTLIEAGPCIVTQIKMQDKDKYEAVQVGFIPKKKKIKKTEKGKEFEYLREFSIKGGFITDRKEDLLKYQAGQQIDVSIFQEGEKVKVAGISKGKGFAGGVKRWGFKGLRETHGSKHEQRAHGATGISGVGRVLKNTKMAGRMGQDRVTARNLKIVKIDKENNLIAVKGAVAGRNGTLVEIRGRG